MQAMRFTRLRPNSLLVLFSVLLMLSGLVGAMAYQWINRASEADRMERQQILDSALRNFKNEFTGSIEEVPAGFRPVARVQREAKIESYVVEVFNHWRSTARRPELIKSLRIGTRAANGNLSIRRYLPDQSPTDQNQASASFASEEWLPSYGFYRDLLERRGNLQGPPVPLTGFAFAVIDGQPVYAFPLLAVTPSRPQPVHFDPPPRGHGPQRGPGPPRPGDRPLPREWGPGRRPPLVPPTGRPYGPNRPPPRGEFAPERGPGQPRQRPSPEGAGEPMPPGRRRPFAARPPQFDREQRLPPQLRNPARRRPVRGAPTPLPPRLIGWCFLELDREYIEQRLLPELRETHFSGAALSVYHLAVLAKDSPEPVFATDPGQSLEFWAGRDGEVPLLTSGINFGPGFDNPAPSPAGEEPPHLSLPSDAWHLTARHAEGSIEAVVQRSRRRDLAVGFGVLSLLLLSVSLLLLSTRRMRRLARRQMEFVAGVSHELRTPLSVIQSAGFNLGSGRVRGDERVQQYGSMIQSEGRRLGDMIEQILSYAGIQSGRKQYQFEEARVSDLIENAWKDYSQTFEEKGWQVETAIAGNLPAVRVDAGTIERAVQNLLQNALKYAADGKWLRISAVASGGRSPMVQITVADRGAGISPDDLPHIFEPFYRGRNVFASSIPGAGLGLSLLQRHLKAHGGRVTVDNKPGEGAAFTLHLPVGKMSSESSESSESGLHMTRQTR